MAAISLDQFEVPADIASTFRIQGFLKRAKECQSKKPVVAYWCIYHVAILLLDKINQPPLSTSKAGRLFVSGLMDWLELRKSEYKDIDIITNDSLAETYIQEFADEIFYRADSSLRRKQASLATADTFQAAATFLDLLAVWQQPLNADTDQRSKYAKLKAVRITKSIRAGEDPNLDPSITGEPEPELPPLDPNDPEVMNILSPHPTAPPLSPLPVQNMAPVGGYDRFGHAASHGTVQTAMPLGHDVSPLEAEQPNDAYFPPLSTFDHNNHSTLQNFYSASTPQNPAARTVFSPPPLAASQLYFPPPPNAGSVAPPPLRNPHQYQQDTFPAQGALSPMFGTGSAGTPAFPPTLQQSRVPPVRSPLPTAPGHGMGAARPARASYGVVDDASMKAAQKHAKFAISALNFADVTTAIKELQSALNKLGA